MIDNTLKELFDQIEKYVIPLIANDSERKFSREENKILALQQINRLNQRIGMIARSNKNEMGEMKVLQNFVSSITIGVKNDNVPQLKYGLAHARNMIFSLSEKQ